MPRKTPRDRNGICIVDAVPDAEALQKRARTSNRLGAWQRVDEFRGDDGVQAIANVGHVIAAHGDTLADFDNFRDRGLDGLDRRRR